MAVLTVEQTINKLARAVAMINDGKYYETSQKLRKAPASESFDVVDDVAAPSK